MELKTTEEIYYGVTDSALNGKTLIQSEITNIISSVNKQINSSLLSDAISLKMDDRSIVTEERFKKMSTEIVEVKKEFSNLTKLVTKPYKDICNSMKKEITDWEASINKLIATASNIVHSIGVANKFEDLTVGFKSGADIDVTFLNINLSQISEDVLRKMVEAYSKEIILKELKKGKQPPILDGVTYNVELAMK